MRPISKASCIVLILFVIVFLGAASYFASHFPSSAQELGAAAPSMAVRITTPQDESHWQLDMPMRIYAESVGEEPVQSMELWMDGRLLQSGTVTNGAAQWSGMLHSLGEHTLVVRVTDSRGNVATSNAVRVIGIEQNLAGLVASYKAKPGDTVAKLAASYGTSPQNMHSANPNLNLNPTSPIPNGTIVQIPAPLPPPPAPQPFVSDAGNPPAPDAPTQPASSIAPNPFLVWIGHLTEQNPPAAPSLALKVNQCSVDVFITDNANVADGLFVYRLDPHSQTFKRIATLASRGPSTVPIEYTDPKLFGSFSYYVSAFNARGEAPSNISQIQVTDPVCQTPFWAGLNLQFTKPLLSLKYDKAYFYLQVNHQRWGRVPQDPNAFLSLPGGIFDVNQQIQAYAPLPAQGQETVEIEAWGWQGGSLIHIGNFTRTLSAPSSGKSAQVIDNPIEPVTLEVCSQPTPNCSQYQVSSQTSPAQFGPYSKISFRWSAPSNAYGIYQVWSSALPATKGCPIDVPGILQSSWVGEQGGSNTFTIDFNQLKNQTDNTLFQIRVLVLLNGAGQSVCELSNVVQVQFNPPPNGQMPDPYSIDITDVNPGQLPNPAKPGCVIITKNDLYLPGMPPVFNYLQFYQTAGYGDTAWWAAAYAPWPVGTELCPPLYQPPPDACAKPLSWQCVGAGLAGIGHGIIQELDKISQTYASVKNWVIDHIERLIPGCDNSNLCKTVVNSAIDAGLAALDIPPDLPNFDQLKQEGESYAAEQILDQVGLSCNDPNDPCHQLVQMAHDQAKDLIISQLDQAMRSQQSQQMESCLSEEDAHALGIQYSLCVPSDAGGADVSSHVRIEPAPDSVGAPAVVTLEIARDPRVPDSALPSSYSCSFKIHSSARNDSWIGQQLQLGIYKVPWTGTAITDGGQGLFDDASGTIPKDVPFGHILAKNAGIIGGIQIPVVLTSPSHIFDENPNDGYWIDAHWNYDVYSPNVDPLSVYSDPDDWPILFSGARAIFSVTESCSSAQGSFQNVFKSLRTIVNPKLPQ